jgi:hypothetical protein
MQGGRKAARILLAFIVLALALWFEVTTAAAEPAEEHRPEAEENRPKEAEENRQKGTQENRKEVEENRQKEAEEVERLQDLFLRSQFVFIRKGEVIVEYNFLYSTDSRIIPVGSAQAIKTSRRFMDNILLARFGLANGLELDVSVPFYIRAEQSTDFGLARVPTQSEGVGDVSGALRYQVWYEKGSRPSLTVEANVKSHTAGDLLLGTGQYNVGGAVTLLKSIDPVVFFAGLGYSTILQRSNLAAGDIIDYRVGMGYSLNDRVSFNMQLTGSLVRRPAPLLGIQAPTSRFEIVNLLFTTTVLMTKRLFMEPLVGIGLTEDAFDATLGFRVAYRF